jgi:fructose-1-phosphate kinase PfkB-like protein
MTGIVTFTPNPSLAYAMRLAVAAGSSAVLNPGTELAHADDTRRLADAVKIREL